METHPLFMRPFVAPAAEAMLTIVAHEEFEAETRRLGIEFLLQFAEKAAATGACVRAAESRRRRGRRWCAVRRRACRASRPCCREGPNPSCAGALVDSIPPLYAA